MNKSICDPNRDVTIRTFKSHVIIPKEYGPFRKGKKAYQKLLEGRFNISGKQKKLAMRYERTTYGIVNTFALPY